MGKTEKQLYIPSPRLDRAGESHVFYTKYYQTEQNDSPNQGRASMIGRLHSAMEELNPGSLVLNIGAGKQVMEKEYRDAYGNPAHRFLTLDVADINCEQLLAPGFEHVIANGEQMPFPDETFALASSNMAIDFMERQALSEVARILKPGSKLLLNLHHPSLIPPDLNTKLRTVNQKMRHQGKPATERQILRKASLEHKRFLREERVLYESIDQIRDTFEPLGFEVERAERAFGGDTWWEADLRKKYSF